MSRERDSEVVHDLVTSKYKIAERNRVAKYRFLSNENVNTLSASKHRGSEPSLAQTEKADVKPVDLSVPGTPVSSRYLQSLGKFRRNPGGIDTDSEGEDDDDEGTTMSALQSALTEGLKQFTSDMEKLKSHDVADLNEIQSPVAMKKEAEPVKLPQTNPKEIPEKKDESPALPLKEPPQISKIERYFRDSARRGSLTRDFTEVVQTFDPKLLHDSEEAAKPGTPVSSKFIKAEKVHSKKLHIFTDKLEALKAPKIVKGVDENRKSSESPPEKPKRVNPVPLTPTGSPDSSSSPSTPPSTPANGPANDAPKKLDPKDFPPISSSGIKADKKTEEVLIIVEKKIVEEKDEEDGKKAVKEPAVIEQPIVAVTAVKEQSAKPVEEPPVKPVREHPPKPVEPPKVEEIKQKSEPAKEVQPETSQGNQTDTKPKPDKESPESNEKSTETKPISRKELSVPGTPVDSRKLFNTNPFDDDSDIDSDIEIIESSEIGELAKEFVGKIEEMLQKTIDEDKMDKIVQPKVEEKPKEQVKQVIEKPKEEAKQAEVNAAENAEKEDKLANIDNPKIKSYFEKAEQEKSYQRTFSEVESFNEPTMDVIEKVERYFKESDEKKSLTRGFSEAVNYIEPINIEQLLTPGHPVSSKVVEHMKVIGEIEEPKPLDPVVLHGMEAFKKAHEALHPPPLQDFKAKEYFEESESRHTLKRDFSEVYGEIGGTPRAAPENPEIKKFFEESEAQHTFKRQFSEVIQTLPPRIKDILPDEKTPLNIERSSRFSVFSAPDPTDARPDSPSIARKHGKKYGIDKYFATSLYRTAYHRSKDQRRGSEPDHRFAIVEDEYVFGESDVLRSQVFQDDDATPIHPIHHKHTPNDGNEEDFDQQNVQFWRDFLKPYTLNLPTDIVMRDELIDKYTKYTLE